MSLGGRVRHLSAVTLVDARGKREIICQIHQEVKDSFRKSLGRFCPSSSLEAIGTRTHLAELKQIGIVQRGLG